MRGGGGGGQILAKMVLSNLWKAPNWQKIGYFNQRLLDSDPKTLPTSFQICALIKGQTENRARDCPVFKLSSTFRKPGRAGEWAIDPRVDAHAARLDLPGSFKFEFIFCWMSRLNLILVCISVFNVSVYTWPPSFLLSIFHDFLRLLCCCCGSIWSWKSLQLQILMHC